MSLLRNLLTAQRRDLDEKRRYVADLENLAERLRRDARRLLRGAEQAADAGGDGTMAWPFAERHCRLQRSIADLDERLAAARDALAAAEQQLRRYERAQLDCDGRHRIAVRRDMRRCRARTAP